MPTLILIRGLPGSGKSYIATRLATTLAGVVGKDQVIELDPDATDYNSQRYREHVERATAEGVDPALHAYRFLRAQAYRAIADSKVTIWNQPFTNLGIFNKMSTNMRLQADEHGVDLRIVVVEVHIDSGVARQRVIARKERGGHGPSDATFERFVRDYVTFKDDGYDVVAVNGDDDIEASLAAIMQKLID